MVECSSPAARTSGESLQLYLTQSSKPEFPYVVIEVGPEGKCSVGMVARPHTRWAQPPLVPAAADGTQCQVTTTPERWQVALSLPLRALGIPAEGFYFNLVRRQADRSAYAWCDLFGGPPSQVEAFARALPVDDPSPWQNGLVLPAEVKVGVNRLCVERPEGGITVRAAHDTLPVDEEIACYHADVPRPFIIHATEPFLPTDAKEFSLEITLNAAGSQDAALVITCQRAGGAKEGHKVSLAAGQHTLKLPVPAGDGDEVSVEAEALVRIELTRQTPRAPLPEEKTSLKLHARHWFAVGRSAGEMNVYREGIRTLSTDRMYWAVTADSVPYFRLRQSGEGAYGSTRRDQGSIWQQAYVYAVALLYKSKHPENPWSGDRRLLKSAVTGMEYALRPAVSMEEHLEPDNRSLQAYLLTYELLKDDIEPERRQYWAYELKQAPTAARAATI
jgi:hypothetical protein